MEYFDININARMSAFDKGYPHFDLLKQISEKLRSDSFVEVVQRIEGGEILVMNDQEYLGTGCCEGVTTHMLLSLSRSKDE